MLAERLGTPADDDLQAELEALQLPLIMRTCPECGGGGFKTVLTPNDPYAPAAQDECPRCGTDGEVPLPQVTNREQAVRVAERRAEIEAQRREAVQPLLERIAKWQALVDQINRQATGKAEFLDYLLTDFHRSAYAVSEKFGSKVPIIPGVTLQRTAGRESVEVLDETGAIQQAKDLGLDQLVRVKEELAKSEVGNLLKSGALIRSESGALVVAHTGEVVDLVSIKRGVDKFAVKVD